MRIRRSKDRRIDTEIFHSQLLLPFNPTPENFIRKILDELHPAQGQLIYDLGCGDGRVLRIAAQEFDLQAKGFEINTKYLLECKIQMKSLPWRIQRKIRIYEKDLFTVNPQDADLVFLYVLPDNYKFLVHVIKKCRSGCLIIFIKYEPSDDIKMEMEITIERKIEAEDKNWLAYIAKKTVN